MKINKVKDISHYFQSNLKFFITKENHTEATVEVNRLEMNTVRRNRFNSWELPKIKGYKKKEVQKEERLDRRELNIKKGTKKWSK